jgi:hypothetical protein
VAGLGVCRVLAVCALICATTAVGLALIARAGDDGCRAARAWVDMQQEGAPSSYGYWHDPCAVYDQNADVVIGPSWWDQMWDKTRGAMK